MPRTARKRSESGIYHIVLRGVNKQTIFYDDEDREVFLNRLKIVKEQMPYAVYAFCLMDNHIHLLLREGLQPIGKIMQKILTSYIFWYNRKYERVGNLFQDRYKSEAIESEEYVLSAMRYIHQNPVKAGMTDSVGEYGWSSHSAYTGDIKSFVDTDFILRILGGRAQYNKFVQAEEERIFLESESRVAISDRRLIQEIEEIYKKHGITDLGGLTKAERSELLVKIKAISGSSLRQISRVTGVPVMIVRTAK